MLDDPADFSLKIPGFVDAQACVDVFTSGQLEVVHFVAPFDCLVVGISVVCLTCGVASIPILEIFWR